MIRSDKIKLDWYKPIERTQRQVKSPEDRLASPFDEVDFGLTVRRCPHRDRSLLQLRQVLQL